MFDLTEHMNTGIAALVADALKVSIRKPRELTFLRAFQQSARLSQARRARHEGRGLRVPPFLIASITSNCNLLCAGCYSRANNSCGCGGASGALMPADRWDALFAEAEELGVCFILLAGGEPMLRPDVLERAAAHPGILFPVFTNGTLFDEKGVGFFDANRNLLPVISMEGGREATDGRRGPGVYDRLSEAMAKLKRRAVLFGASITVTKENLDEVTGEAFVGWLKRSGCSVAFYVEYVPVDGGSAGLAPGDAERAKLEEGIEKLKRKFNMLFISFPGDEKYTGGCLAAGRGFVHVNADGSLEPCPFSPYSDSGVADKPLAEALKSPFLTGLRENGMLLGEHDGGCLLFEKQEEVKDLLASCKGYGSAE